MQFNRLFGSSLMGLALAGCATTSLTSLDKAQVQTAKSRAKLLKAVAPQAYALISDRPDAGALVIIEGTKNYQIVSGDSPVDAMARFAPSSASINATCAFFYPYGMAINPTVSPCSSIQADLTRMVELRGLLTAIEVNMKQVQSDIAIDKSRVDRILKEVSAYDRALTTSFRMGLANSDLISAHRRQISILTQQGLENKRALAELNTTFEKLNRDLLLNTSKIEEAIAKLPK